MTIVGSEEIYRKLSSQIESQFPAHIREDAPRFVSFLKAYFEYLEQTGKAGDAGRGLVDYMDIDRTLADFVEYFRREFLINIPDDVLADKRLLVKHIRSMYASRGSADSFRFLFRVMFDEEIDLYFPGEDILRTSDGRWVQETVIRGVRVTGVPDNLNGHEVTGSISGATARVQEILRILAAGITVVQLVVEQVVGSFVEDEIVSDAFGNSIRVFNAVGSLESVQIVDGGAFHQAGDLVSLAGFGGGAATGTISGTTDTFAITAQILNGGSGYRADANTTITLFGGSPTIPAQFRVLNLSNTTTSNICSTIISPAQNVVLVSGAAPHNFGVGSGNFPTSNATTTLLSALTFADVTTGSINTISLMTAGAGYIGELPIITAIDAEVAARLTPDLNKGGFEGRNAVITASRAYGSITSVDIITTDINFLKNDSITITNTTRSSDYVTDLVVDQIVNPAMDRGLRRTGTYPASVTASIEGSFALPGRYTDSKGFLSWNNKLRDGDYYQEFSYVIKVNKALNTYADVVKSLVHPAGMKMFGSYLSASSIDVTGYSNVGSAVQLYRTKGTSPTIYANSTIQILGATPKTITLSNAAAAYWLNNGSIVASQNVIVIPVGNTSATNGRYQVNAVSSNSVMTLKLPYEHGLLPNGHFYYATSYSGTI